jgi:cyclophilin family peptidyl-prolyl cis-trans isomerase
MILDPSANYAADFRTTLGNFRIELLSTQAPVTVNNFVFLAQQGFYDGLTFHRVIENFMIQGGDPTGTGGGGPGYQFEDEIVPGLVFDTPGKLAMANSGADTNGSQFFITTVPTDWLNGRHTIFGMVIDGQSVVDAISRAETGARDAPAERVVIDRIDIIQTARQ